MDILKVKQNGVWTAIPAIIGPRGIGITSITKTGTSGLTDTYTITFSDNTTTTFTLNNGAVPNLTIGTVTEGATAAATITGTAAAPILNLVLPNANVPTRVSQLENDSHYAVDANYVHTDNNYTTEEKTKLSGIAAGAEVNVNADWNAVSGDAQILNKPTIPDIQINGTSIVENGVANIPLGSSSTFGVIKLATIGSGLTFNSGNGLRLNIASYALIKKPQADTINSLFRPIAPAYQHASVFYGLALAAGDTTQYDSENTIGAYTDEAKAAIQSMLGVPSTSALTVKQDALTFDSTPTASSTNPVTSGGIKSYVDTAVSNINTMKIHICTAQEYNSETGVPTIQNPDTQTFYLVPGGEGSNLFIEWAYVNSVWERFGSADVEVPVQDVQVSGASILQNGIANIPVANRTIAGVVKHSASSNIKTGTDTIRVIAPANQHESAFYGLAKAAGDSTQSTSSNAVGTYTDEAKAAIQQMLDVPSTNDIPEVPVQDVQVNGISVLDAQGVANVSVASSSSLGVVKTNINDGISVRSDGQLLVYSATSSNVKSGTQDYRPVTPYHQHESTFYGLSKVAGVDLANETVTLGTYPETSKTAIKAMLGVQDGLKVVRLI